VDNTAFTGRMRMLTVSERFFQQEVERKMREIGPSEAIDRLLSKYGSVSTKKNYLTAIARAQESSEALCDVLGKGRSREPEAVAAEVRREGW